MRFPPANYREKIWDHCAGFVIVEEAGGKVRGVHCTVALCWQPHSALQEDAVQAHDTCNVHMF